MYLNNCRLWYRKTLLRNYFLFFPTGRRARNRLGFITQPDSFLQAMGKRPADTCLRCISVNQSDCSTGSALTDQGTVPPIGPKQGAQNEFHMKNSPYFPGLREEEVDFVLGSSSTPHKKLRQNIGKARVPVTAAGTPAQWRQSLPHTSQPSVCGNSNRSRCTFRVQGRDDCLGRVCSPPLREGKEHEECSGSLLL